MHIAACEMRSKTNFQKSCGGIELRRLIFLIITLCQSSVSHLYGCLKCNFAKAGITLKLNYRIETQTRSYGVFKSRIFICSLFLGESNQLKLE